MTIRADAGARNNVRRSKARRWLWAIPVIIAMVIAIYVAATDEEDDQEPVPTAGIRGASESRTARSEADPRLTSAYSIADTGTSMQSQPKGSHISRKEFGERWPFLNISSGELACVEGKYAVLIANDGKTYAINMEANSAVRGGSRQWIGLDEIWREDPNFPGAKIDITPILIRAEALCR